MQVRCLQCKTTLIHEAVGHPAEYRSAVELLDAKVWAMVGAVAGLVVTVFYLKFFSDQIMIDNKTLGVFGGMGASVGALLARVVVAIRNSRDG